MAHKQTQAEWEEEMCIKILTLLRGELYLDFRYLDAALCALSFAPDRTLPTLASDGISLFYPPEQILRVYPANPLFLDRAYLHSVLHCIFRHLWMRGRRDPFCWGISCDIAVEYLIDSFGKPTTKRALSWLRIQVYEQLRAREIPLTAAAIYREVTSIDDPEEQLRLAREFHTDDHRYWPKEETPSPSAAKAGQNWEKLGRRAQEALSMHGQETADAASAIQTQIEKGRSRRTYREFLRRFTVLKEELSCDPDEFDLNYYTYGLRTYGNLPLVEPLESREVHKISEFVIVVDTSYSTSGALVKRFLSETFEIIRQRDSFFRKSHIRILQCDNRVQSDVVVTSEAEAEALLNRFTLIGGGGTDFRPAFSYVNDLLHRKILTELRGLLYFTDGKGIFPKKRPPYETAFLFFEREIPENVPPWAMKMNLLEEDLL